MTVIIMIVEIALYSAVLSPFILLNADKEESFSKQLLVGHSTVQGNYLLVIRDQNDVPGGFEKHALPSTQFKLGDSIYTFYGITLPGDGVLKEDLLKNSHVEVVTRRGIIASFNSGVEVADVRKTILFNRYYLERDAGNAGLDVELKSEYSLRFILAIIIFTTFSPGMLFALSKIISKILDRKVNSSLKDWIVLVIIFLPFIFSVMLPAVLNYCYVMGPILFYTNSYLLSIALSILMPVFLSLLVTTKVADYLTRGSKQSEQHLEDDSPFLNEREKRAMFVLALSIFLYFYILNFALPLNIQAKIMYDLLFFSLWFLSLSVAIFIGYNCLDNYVGNYTGVDDKHLLANIKDLESKTGNKIYLFLKQHSKEEFNAWVYSLNSLFYRQICIYLTEGIVNKLNRKEITAVLAHEIGHIKLNHHKYAFLLSLLVIFSMGIVVFYSRKFMLSFGWWHYLVTLTVFVSASVMIIRWLPNMVSKKLEYKADEYAVRLLSNKELYVNTLIKIHELENDSCVFTSTKEWKETHPSLQKRISHLEKVFPSGENYG